MLCRSIAAQGLKKIQELLIGADMAEIRIEKSGLDTSCVKQLFSCHQNLIATCRDEGLAQHQRLELLIAAIDGGAKWIDIEVESDIEYISKLVKYAKNKGCKVIVSYHNYGFTPDATELNRVAKECRAKGADLVKIATMVNAKADNNRLMELYNLNFPVISFGMGSLGRKTRIDALKKGAPFTFVRCDNESETAPGQLTENEINNILNN